MVIHVVVVVVACKPSQGIAFAWEYPSLVGVPLVVLLHECTDMIYGHTSHARNLGKQLHSLEQMNGARSGTHLLILNIAHVQNLCTLSSHVGGPNQLISATSLGYEEAGGSSGRFFHGSSCS